MAKSLKTIVIGSGTMGRHISELLEAEKHDVVVVDRNEAQLDKIRESMDVQTIVGDGADPSTLIKAGAKDAELVLALTNADEVNLLAAFTARKLGAAHCVARARSPWYSDTGRFNLRAELGIDLVMNPEHLTALEIIRYLDNPDALQLARFAYGRVQLLTLVLDAESPFAGKALKDCKLPENILIVVRTRGNEVAIPKGDTTLEAGDKVTIMGMAEALPESQHLFHAATDKVRDITIAGGGVMGSFLAETLERRGFSVTIIEVDRARCQTISERLTRAQVIFGDATEKGFMKEERISNTDVFVAVTGDDENNLMSCLLAKELGVEQTVVKLARPDYASLVQQFGIDVALSPRNVMAERILTLVSRGRIRAMTLLENGQVEVIETVAEHGSPMVGTPLSDLAIPEGALISTIVRLGKTIVPRGTDAIEPGDIVILVGFKDAIDQLEQQLLGE